MSYGNKYKKKVNSGRVKVVRNIGDGEVLKAILSREDKNIELGFSKVNKFIHITSSIQILYII